MRSKRPYDCLALRAYCVYKYTGKERDGESGLDNFGARYNASTMGRFMTPDPLLNNGRPSNPQTWNRYSYALNNPLKIKDPTGLYNVNCGDDKGCQKSAKRMKEGLEKLQNKVDKMKDGDQKTRLEHSLGAMGTANDGNNVNVSFGAIAGTATATTAAHFDSATNSYSSFDVKFDMSNEVERAAAAYGKEGEDNGVELGSVLPTKCRRTTARRVTATHPTVCCLTARSTWIG